MYSPPSSAWPCAVSLIVAFRATKVKFRRKVKVFCDCLPFHASFSYCTRWRRPAARGGRRAGFRAAFAWAVDCDGVAEKWAKLIVARILANKTAFTMTMKSFSYLDTYGTGGGTPGPSSQLIIWLYIRMTVFAFESNLQRVPSDVAICTGVTSTFLMHFLFSRFILYFTRLLLMASFN